MILQSIVINHYVWNFVEYEDSTAVPFILPPHDHSTLTKNTSSLSEQQKQQQQQYIITWSNFPITRFTNHVLGIIYDWKLEKNFQPHIQQKQKQQPLNTKQQQQQQSRPCSHIYHIEVTKHNNSTTTFVHCQSKIIQDFLWCRTLRRIVMTQQQQRQRRRPPIPYNVSIGFVLNDRFDPNIYTNNCFGSSSPKARMVMPNMEEIREMLRMSPSQLYNNPQQQQDDNHPNTTTTNDDDDDDTYRWIYDTNIPWTERDPIPIFRGTAWSSSSSSSSSSNHPWNISSNCSILFSLPRYQAVALSYHFPHLMNAKFNRWDTVVRSCCSTMSYYQTTTSSSIPPKHYFSRYQVAIVLPGIGAAFRTSIHFMTRTAVLLGVSSSGDDQEWFFPYLTPYVHYIPWNFTTTTTTGNHPNDLLKTLYWIRDYPDKVQQIATNGRIFWETYLTFSHHEDHIYELVYRLSEYLHTRSTD